MTPLQSVSVSAPIAPPGTGSMGSAAMASRSGVIRPRIVHLPRRVGRPQRGLMIAPATCDNTMNAMSKYPHLAVFRGAASRVASTTVR